MPLGPVTTIRVSLFLGGPGTNFDFFALSFQVPRKGSVWAISGRMDENAKTNTMQTPNSFFIVVSFPLKFLERSQHRIEGFVTTVTLLSPVRKFVRDLLFVGAISDLRLQ
jgi:hypothetical protein